MKNTPVLFTALIAALCIGLISYNKFATAEDQIANVEIEHPYAFATAASQKNGVILLTIYNKADQDLRITSAHVTPDVADRAELHTHIMDGDTMMMREVEGYDIPAGEHLALTPMGNHIMLIDLLEPLELDSQISLTLGFEDGSMTQIDVPIIAPGTKPHGAEDKAGSESHEHEHDHHQDHSHH